MAEARLRVRASARALLLLAPLGAAAAWAAPLEAQSWRTMTTSRQATGSDAVEVEVRYGAGTFSLRPADRSLLYRMELRYDEEVMDPVSSFERGRLELGVEGRGRTIRLGRGSHEGSMKLALGRAVPIDLSLELGAVEADVDLGGLNLRRLDFETGASASRLDVSEPVEGSVSRARIQVGAAEFNARRLGNLRAERLSVSAGVGDVTLDFSGEWARDLDVDVEMGVGSLQLRFPEGIGVRLVKRSFLTSLDADGLVKRSNDTYETPGWSQATRRITIDVEAAFGSIDVLWLR